MTWASVIVTALKLIASILSYFNSRNMIKAGEDKVIAKQAMTILESTKHGKQIREKVKSLPDDEADRLWNDLAT